MPTIQIGAKTFTVDEVQQLIAAGKLAPVNLEANTPANKQNVAQKHDATATVDTMPAPHGLWSDWTTPGVLTPPGVEPEVPNAMVLPPQSVISDFYIGVTDYIQPMFDIITGVDAATGENATGFCAPAPKAGAMRLCMSKAFFGEWKIETETASSIQTGGYLDRADYDKRVIGGALFNQYPFFPVVPGFASTPDTKFNRLLANAIWRVGIHTQRTWEKVFYEGNKALSSGSTETGFIREFDGLDQLIKTGHVDEITGEACNAADSIVEDFDNVNIGDTASDSDIVDFMTGIHYALETLNSQNGYGDDWDGEIHMEPDLFYALTRIWPRSYLTEGNTVLGLSDATPTLMTASDNISMRNAMRTGKYLMMDQKRVPVKTTRAISRTAVGNGFSSNVYFVVRRVDGWRSTYLEGFNVDNADARSIMQSPTVNGQIVSTNGGLYQVTNRRTDFCVEHMFAALPRLVLRTPYLCARLTNVNYTLRNYSRDAYPGDPYYKNGGRYVGVPRYEAS